jgi:DNA-binding HxlR family transcriptional regulator
LEESNLIEKLMHPESKVKGLYRLTQKGIDLLPILVEMYLWSDKYFTMPDDLKATIEAGKKDKDGFIKLISERLKNKIA